MKFLKFISLAIVWLIVLILFLWAFGAIFYDAPFSATGNKLTAFAWAALALFLLIRFRKTGQRIVLGLGLFLIVLLPWLTKKPVPRNDWAAEFARIPSATVDGDAVTFQNFRNFDYKPDGTAIERWETRIVHLSNLKYMDFFVTYFGSELIAHPIFSFDFGPEGHIAFSIESRRKTGETYGPIEGLYKRYGLIYIVSEEADVIRVRSNYRTAEEVYLYRLQVKPETPRTRFLEYVKSIQRLNEEPAFYNSVTDNCTTAIRAQLHPADRNSLDWRILFNGKLDELFLEKHLILQSPPFPELKRQSHINAAARANPDAATFSQTIRQDRPGF